MPEITPLVIAGAVSGNSTAAIDLNSMIPELRQTVSRMGKVIMKDLESPKEDRIIVFFALK